MTILIFGKDGQVGTALQNTFFNQAHLCPLNTQVIFLGRNDCDLSNLQQLESILNQVQPNIIINTAAYTDVEQSETEADLVYLINAKAPELMAQYIAFVPQGLLIQYSTDYVFGDSQVEPYSEDVMMDRCTAFNTYGQSKWFAESFIGEMLNSHSHRSRYYIIRSSWLYGNGLNFIQSILRLLEKREDLKVIADQVGAPTPVDLVANITWHLVEKHLYQPIQTQSGIYQVVANGYTSWHGIAQLVANLLEDDLYFEHRIGGSKIKTILTEEYDGFKSRPRNSRMHNKKIKEYLLDLHIPIEIHDWQFYLQKYVRQVQSVSALSI